VKRLASVNKSLIVDVDQTVCDLTEMWLNWLAEQTGVEKDPFSLENYKLVNYDLTYYWKDELKKFGIDGFDFWRNKHLYQNVKPLPWCQDVLEGLHELGYKIVIASHCKGYSMFSKHEFCKKYFPYMEGFLATKEKHLVRGEVLIDDRNINLTRMDGSFKLIRKTTPFTQEVELTRPCLDYSWTMGINKLVEYIES